MKEKLRSGTVCLVLPRPVLCGVVLVLVRVLVRVRVLVLILVLVLVLVLVPFLSCLVLVLSCLVLTCAVFYRLISLV